MFNNQINTVNRLIDLVNISGNSITNSRRRIIAEIARKEGLFTSEELTKSLPNIGRATVYRTLKLLHDIGSICRINIVDEHSYYTLSLSDHHHHTVCKECNKIEEINLIGFEKDLRLYEKNINGNILSHNLEIYIVCGECD